MHRFLKMGNFRIGVRLTLGFLQVILLVLIVGVVALYQIKTLAGLLNEIHEHPLTVGYAARDIRGEIYLIHDLVRKIPLTENPAELNELERTIREVETSVYREFEIIEERFLGDKEDVKNARNTFAGWKSLRDEHFRIARAEGKEKLGNAFYVAEQKYADDTRAKIQTIVDFSGRKAKEFVHTSTVKANETIWIVTVMTLLAMIFSFAVSFLITRSITPGLNLIVRRMRDIARGDLSQDVEIDSRDEVGDLAGSFREMQENLRNKSEVAAAIAEGDFSRPVDVSGKQDVLGNAILTMTESLKDSKSLTDLQDWNKTGKNELNGIMAGESDINVLSREIIGFLAKYLKAQIGTLYLAKDNGPLALSGSYAFSKRKSLSAAIEPGEGLVGQAAVEKEIISITNIPEDYIRINSSFGESPPRNIVAVPCLFENSVKCVIELGAFEEFSDKKLSFLREVSNPIGIALNTVQNRERLKALLDETQQQAARLMTQEEELRAANEELEEQTKSLRESEEKLRQQQEEMEVINEELHEKNESLERQKHEIAAKNDSLEDVSRQLEVRARELEITGRYKSEFLANMSHELRTPLNSLLLLSRDLAENTKGNMLAEQVESAKIIQNSGIELLHLIDEILDLSKIEAGKMVLNIADVRLKVVADYVESSFRHFAAEKALDLKIIMDDTLPESISTDGRRLEQILKNLVSNALKFTDQGTVTVEVHRPALTVNLSRSGLNRSSSVAFSVRDTGIGIPEDKQLQVFEAFQQAEGGTNRKYGGTGLGLSISRELAKLLGGEIQLESRPGGGSNFTLYLPVELKIGGEIETVRETVKAAPIPVAESNRTPVARNEGVFLTAVHDDRADLQEGDRRILVIEDDPGFAKILVDQCHSKGFKALVSSTGEAGLSLAEQYLPGAIILDIKLPGMTGWTVLNALKENPATRHIPVHVMSVEEASMDAMQKGAIGFLTKPVNREELEGAFRKIEEVMEKKIKDLLLVEDSAQQRFGIVNLISDAEVRIVEVDSGAQALAALKNGDFDCMILDLGLPDMTGFELLKRIFDEKGVCTPPVIVYTGKELSREEEVELRKHAESIIIKGVRSEERLLDETALFLHKTVDSMNPRKRDIIINLHNRDAMLSGKTVLMVDDDMRNLFALSKVLADKGMNVIKAENGQKALEALDNSPAVDLVLLDIMMPVMDGYETSKRIRAKARFRNLPIIALTAKAMKDDRDRCIAAGANDYLSKPVDVERLFSLLRVWLYKR